MLAETPVCCPGPYLHGRGGAFGAGNHGRTFGMSEFSRRRLDDFWELLDHVLNAILFLLMGLEIFIIAITMKIVAFGLMAIVAVLFGRVVSVGIPVTLTSTRKRFEWSTLGIPSWGGLRGGLSIAMALSLPNGPEKSLILPATYIVVLFSVLVQFDLLHVPQANAEICM